MHALRTRMLLTSDLPDEHTAEFSSPVDFFRIAELELLEVICIPLGIWSAIQLIGSRCVGFFLS